MTRAILSLLLLFAIAWPASAHPFPNLRCDRTVHVRISAVFAVVKYTVECNAMTMMIDGNTFLTASDTANVKSIRSDYVPVYAKKKATYLADELIASLDEKELKFRLDKPVEIEFEGDNHIRLRYQFRADISPRPGVRSQFRFEDLNYDGQPGKIALTCDTETGLTVHDLEEPGGLRGKSQLDLKPGEERKLRTVSAIIEVLAAAKPVVIEAPVTIGEPVIVSGEKPGLVADLLDRGLTALFDSTSGVGVLLLAAFVFGMGHAFTPGHGKTLVAAYLVGERGTMRHALVLGITTTLAHTGSVIGVACILWWCYRDGVPETAQGWLQFAGGMLILLAGMWLLSRRIRGKADHVHFGAGHHHHGPDCGHTHDPDPSPKSFGWLRVVLLGLGGGLIPCWDAVMLLFVAISADRLAFAVPLLIAFSLGLAVVLVALGVGVVLAHRVGATKFAERRWFQLLPVFSAALLMVMGLWLAREGVQRLVAGATESDTPALKG